MNTIAIPDLYFEIENRFAVNEWVCLEGFFIGNHTETLFLPDGRSLPATNKVISLSTCIIYKIKDDKIAETHVYYDLFAFRTQLGII